MTKKTVQTLNDIEQLSAEIKAMVLDGSLYSLPQGARRRIIRRMQRLYGTLAGQQKKDYLRPLITSIAVLTLSLGCSSGPGDDNDQDTGLPSDPGPVLFKAPVQNPFALQKHSDQASPAFIDIDNDDDLDLFVAAYNDGFKFYKNVGSETVPLYSLQADNLGLPDTTDDYTHLNLTFLDYDGDEDLDAFIGEWGNAYCMIDTYEWNGTTFASADKPDGLPWMQASGDMGVIPAGADLDADGDDDVVLIECLYDYYGGFEPQISYKSNNGDSTFSDGASTMGLEAFTGDCAFPFFADMDGDDDPDAIFGTDDGGFQYFTNSGSAAAPSFDSPVSLPFDLVSVTGPAVVAAVDIDNDGDIDVFAGDGDGNINFFENTSIDDSE